MFKQLTKMNLKDVIIGPWPCVISKHIAHELNAIETSPEAFNILTFDKTNTTSLDDDWSVDKGLLNLLQIDADGSEYQVLKGAKKLLRRGAVDYIQLDYDSNRDNSESPLKLIYYYLRRFGYHIFEVKGARFNELPEFKDNIIAPAMPNLLAVNERHLERLKGRKQNIDIWASELRNMGIPMKGVIHIGAQHENHIEKYKKLKLNPIILFDTNTTNATNLGEIYKNVSNIKITEKIISMPMAFESDTPSFTLDECFINLSMKRSGVNNANILILDTQTDMSFITLQGSIKTLRQLDAIQLYVSYDTPNPKHTSIWDVDCFLNHHGFIRSKTISSFSSDRGNALYVRKPIVANSRIGAMGQFGNQVLQYAYLQCHANEMGYVFQNSQWVGDQIFNVQAGVANAGKGLRKITQNAYSTKECNILNNTDRLANADITGYFQYDMRIYSPHKETIYESFSFKGKYAKRVKHITSILKAQAGITVGLHLRRGDYGTGIFYIAPNKWYITWLKELEKKYGNLTVFIATDDYEAVSKDFFEFNVINASAFSKDFNGPVFFDDFAALTICDKIATSNSTFSFIAAFLNSNADEFMRPDLSRKSLVPFEPWSSEPLQKTEIAEKHGEEFMSERAKSRSKYKLKKLFRLL